jgi:hypothetical protein
MPFEFIWLIPNKILLSRWYGAVTVDDARVLTDELAVVFDEADTLIHTVIDTRDLTDFDPEFLKAYFASPAAAHPYRGRIAIVQAPTQWLSLVDHANQMTGRMLARVFETRDEARDYLLANDSPPPPLAE